jgi:hypothetical protein
MTLQQLSRVKRWQVAHRACAPLEYHVWDTVLTLWLMGWVGLPAAVLVQTAAGVAACIAMSFAPAFYVELRTLLHQTGRLRCDWLPVLP